jgi:hypothetical protein
MFKGVLINTQMRSPLAVNRATGELLVNPPEFDKLSDFGKRFWLLHELGHLEFNTPDEYTADLFAIKNMAGTTPRSLKKINETVRSLLVEGTPEQQERIRKVLMTTLKYDYLKNGNQKAKNLFNYLNGNMDSNDISAAFGDTFVGGILTGKTALDVIFNRDSKQKQFYVNSGLNPDGTNPYATIYNPDGSQLMTSGQSATSSNLSTIILVTLVVVIVIAVIMFLILKR